MHFSFESGKISFDMNSKLNICLISCEYPPETGFGGIGTYTYNLAQGLSRRGHKVTVISQSVKGEREYFDKRVKIYRISDKKLPIKGMRRLLNLLTSNAFNLYNHSRSVFRKIEEIKKKEGINFDIIEGPLWNAECAAYSKKVKAPLVVRLETPIFKVREILNRPPLKRVEFLEKKSLDKATVIASISRNVGKLIVNKYKIDSEKIKFAPLGIAIPRIRKPLFKSKSYKLLYVGRLEERKGIREFIEALGGILKKNKDITVDIVGRDCGLEIGLGKSYYELFLEKVPKELQNRVKFYGFVSKERLESFYKSCDVLIAPSRYESFGLIYLEAFLFGKPVIATKVGGVVEIVDNSCGILVKAESAEEIERAVLKIFTDEKLRKSLGEGGFSKVRSEFSIDKMVENTLSIYSEAINLKGSSRLRHVPYGSWLRSNSNM